VVRLAPVPSRVVQLPDVIIKGWDFFTNEQPGCLVPRHRGPALVVDAAVAEHLEVLRLMAFSRIGVVERVQHADTLDGALLNSINRHWLRESCRLENSRCDIDDVVKLPTHLTLGRNAFGPVYDGAIARAAPVRSDLLGPLVGRIHRMRPAHRV